MGRPFGALTVSFQPNVRHGKDIEARFFFGLRIALKQSPWRPLLPRPISTNGGVIMVPPQFWAPKKVGGLCSHNMLRGVL